MGKFVVLFRSLKFCSYCFASLISLFASSAVFSQVATSEWRTQDDHQNMMQQLGIEALRPGPSGQAENPNAANTNEALANPYPEFPDILTLNSGEKVITASMWMNQRRGEIVELFEREVIGRVPSNVPNVSWSVIDESPAGTDVGGIPVLAKQLQGHVDNSTYPAINVNIEMTIVTPANTKGPVPILMMFGRSALPGTPPPPSRFPGPPPGLNNGPSSQERLIAAGWGYASINPASIQADNGEGLTKGIIGLVNKGQARSPEDWGSLRAWAWGAARGLDYLETQANIDSKHVGIEGVSRYGKAALVTQAFEPRFNMVLVGSSGEGGASPYRRNFGEALENITGSGEYHWMAGNFMKYGAAESSFGSMNSNDLPIDSHMLIALSAPRPIFISYGIPERGDALWLDQQGSYMATVAASEVFRLLGVKGLSDTNHYSEALMPPVNVGLVDGELAWRQHNGGHEDRSNMEYFIEWANEKIGFTSP